MYDAMYDDEDETAVMKTWIKKKLCSGELLIQLSMILLRYSPSTVYKFTKQVEKHIRQIRLIKFIGWMALLNSHAMKLNSKEASIFRSQ